MRHWHSMSVEAAGSSTHLSKRIAGLDGIRGIAVLAVVGCHTSIPFMLGGGIGVDIFFVLSGFLISRVLIAEFMATGRIDFAGFYWRRFLRIVPPLIILCLGWLCLALIFDISLRSLARDFSVTLTFIADYTRSRGGIPHFLAPTWSISVEEQFYLIWPFVAIGLLTFIRARQSIVSILVLTAVAVGAWRFHRFETTAPDDLVAVYDSFDARFDALCLGCALAFLTEENLRIIGKLWPAAVIVIAGFIYASAWNQPWMYLGGFSLIGISSAILIAAVASRSSPMLAMTLDSGPLLWFGTISYSLYLWHWPPLLIMMIKGYSGYSLLLSIPISIVLAAASTRLVERQATLLKPMGSRSIRIVVSLVVPVLFVIGVLFVPPSVHR